MNKETRYFYIRLSNGGVITGAAKRDLEQGRTKVGFAFCSWKDSFRKAFGRKIAEGRIAKKPIWIGGLHSTLAIKDALSVICADEGQRVVHGVPNWVPKDANSFLLQD